MRTPILLLAITALASCGDAGTEPVEGTEAALPAETDSAVLANRSLDDMAPLDGDPAGASPADDIKLDARTRYATYYRAAYAPGAVCDGSTPSLELERETIRYGDTECQIGSIAKSGSGISVTGQSCKANGANAPDRTFTLLMTEMQSLDLETGSTRVSLKRCGTA